MERMVREEGAKATNWPNFFIVGAAKAGTSSLHEYLGRHPQIYMSPRKEPHFFSQVSYTRESEHFLRPAVGEVGYAALFEGAERFDAVGESSTSYLWDERAPYRIRERVPEARIIILLRDPIERAYSHYLADVRYDRVRLPFSGALLQDAAREKKVWGVSRLYVEMGRYASQVSRYLEAFSPDCVRVYLSDDLRRNPEDVLRDVASFLGVDPGAIGRVDEVRAHNVFAVPRNPIARRVAGNRWARQAAVSLIPRGLGRFVYRNILTKRAEKPEPDPRAIKYLAEAYEGEIEELQRLLGRDLPSLRKGW
jgi:Sulfotransferase domain